MASGSRTVASRSTSNAAALSRAGDPADSVADSAAVVTPRLFPPVPWVALEALAAASAEASVAVSTAAVVVVVSAAALEVAAAVSEEAATLAVVTADHPTDSLGMRHQDLVAPASADAADSTGTAASTAAVTVVVATVEAIAADDHPTTTGLAVAATVSVTATETADAGPAATWNPSDLGAKVGIVKIEAETASGIGTGTTATLTDPATTTAGSEATTAAATKTQGSCAVTERVTYHIPDSSRYLGSSGSPYSSICHAVTSIKPGVRSSVDLGSHSTPGRQHPGFENAKKNEKLKLGPDARVQPSLGSVWSRHRTRRYGIRGRYSSCVVFNHSELSVAAFVSY
jgi:hypothetical protein